MEAEASPESSMEPQVRLRGPVLTGRTESGWELAAGSLGGAAVVLLAERALDWVIEKKKAGDKDSGKDKEP